MSWIPLRRSRFPAHPAPRPPYRPAVERLEDRTVPAIVTNLNDAGAGSLRQAILAANATPQAETITFQAGLSGTIPLINGAIVITSPVTINGPGAGVLTVSGNNVSRIFEVFAPLTPVVSISGLTLTKGNGFLESGGAILANSSLTLTGMVLTASTATRGGGVFMNFNTRLTLENSTVSGNFATSGGGLFLFERSVTLIRNCTISRNQIGAGDGGGVAAFAVADLTVENSTISGNTAFGRGGGISFEAFLGGGPVPGGRGTVSNSTVAFNRADNDDSDGGFGGGIAILRGPLALRSTLVADNSVGLSGQGPDVAGSVVAINCLVENRDRITFLAGSANNVTDADPLLGPLANNSGATQTHALLAGSPAIDAGLNFTSQQTDQRGPGFARVVGPTADIGAFEVQPPPPPPLPPPPTPPAPTPRITALAFRRRGVAKVRVKDAATGALRAILTPFRGFRGRLRLLLIDVNSDGALDLVVKAVVNGKRKQKVFDAVTLAPLPQGLT